MNRVVLLFGILLLGLMMLGCAGSSNPAQPSVTPDALSQSALNHDGNSRMLWGFWHVTIDPQTMQADITPIRGIEFTCNVTQFLQPPISPTNMIMLSLLSDSTPETGFFAVDVTIKHPFPSLLYYSGFDVRGIFISDGTYTTDQEGLVYAGVGDSRLLNADGWTRWWNPTEFTSYEFIFGYTQGKLGPPVFPSATLNGYKYFSDDIESEDNLADLDPSTRGSFSNMGLNTRRYDIQFKMDDDNVVFDFNYAVDASWDEPDPAFEPDYPIEAFALSANCREAYWIDADFADSTAWYIDAAQSGGDLHVALEIGDWGALSPGVYVPDEVSAIRVESPDFGFSPVDVLPTATASDGNGISTSVFTFDLVGVQPSGTLDHSLLVSVIASSPDNYEPQVTGGDLFDYPDEPLAAYMFFNVPILDYPPNDSPTVISIVPDTCNLDTCDIAVQITGTDFADDAYAQLVKNDNPSVVLEAAGEVVSPDGTTIDCTFSMFSVDGAEIGLYNVVVTNPGPPSLSDQLDDGFTIDPGSSCDEVYDTIIYSGSMQSYASQVTWDIAFNRDGLLLAKVSSGGYHLYGFDVTQNGAVTGTPVITNMQYGSSFIAKMDVDDYTGNILYVVWSGHDNEIITYTEDGTLIEIINNQNTTVVQCMDTDDDGAIWTVGRDGGNYFINHYTWDGSNYNYDAAGSANVTGDFSYHHIFDCAVSYSEDKLMVFGQNVYPYKGELLIYDISSGTPVKENKLSQFLPVIIGSHGAGSFYSACDIEIDHSVPCLESCRVMIMERCQPMTLGTAFLKMDIDGNILDTNHFQSGYPDQQFYSIAINPYADDPDGAYLACGRDGSYGSNPRQFDVYEVPPGW